MKPSYLIILLVMNFFWAGVYSAYKIIGPDVADRRHRDPSLRAGGALPAGGLAVAAGARATRADLFNTCVMGVVMMVLGQRLQVYGNYLGTAGNSAVLMAVEPLITSLAAAVFLREHIGPRRLAGFALGMCGVALLHGVWRKDFQWTRLGAEPHIRFVIRVRSSGFGNRQANRGARQRDQDAGPVARGRHGRQPAD